MNIRSIHKQGLGRRFIASVLCFVFLSTSVAPAHAQSVGALPAPGMRIGLTPEFRPLLLKAVKVHKDNPFQFDFIVDAGDSGLNGEALKDESKRLIKYFLASLTTPENDLWVNLSPYEQDKIIPETFGTTEMGRDLLSQDYILKQLTASLVYPEEGLGKEFWNKVYAEAQAKFGTTDVPVDTFNKVWIVPEKAVVYENGVSAYVGETKLKVMLEQDYVALTRSQGPPGSQSPDPQNAGPLGSRGAGEPESVNALGSAIVREIIIPALEQEVNTGKNFARLRQVYHSLVLANWYKKRLKDSIIAKIYLDKSKVKGVDIEDKAETQKIYERYVEAFKKGVYNYIREDVDPATQEVIPRKYFSGGFALSAVGQVSEFRPSGEVPATTGAATYELGVDTTPSQLKKELTVELPEAKMLAVAAQARDNPGRVAAVQVTAAREELEAVADFIGKDIRYYSRKAKDVSFQSARLEKIKFTIANLGVLEGLHAIAAVLPGLEKDENGEYKFLEYVRERGGTVQYTLYATAGVIRLEKYKDGNDVLVIIHKVFERFNHAGRDRNAVYASSEAKVQHELVELAVIKRFASDNGIDISKGLGKGIRAWANNKNEDRLARQNQLRQLDYDAHQSGLKAEADFEGRSYEIKTEKIRPGTKIIENFDWAITGDDVSSGEEMNDISGQIKELEGSRALSSYDIEQFTARYPEWDWQKAAEVPWREVIHDPLEQPQPVNQNQINLWRNQIEVRRLFLKAFKSLLDGQIKDEEFGAVLTEMNVALNLGAARSSYYFSTTIGAAFESIEELKQASGRPRIADFKSRAAAISKRLRSIILSKDSIPFDDVLLDLAAFYRFYMGRYLFEAGNNSLSMNMINGLLRLQGSNGIPHHHLDTKYKEYFFGQMRDPRFLNEFVEHVNDANKEIQRDGAGAEDGARSFEPSTAMWDFFQGHGEFTQGWWIAFDVDKAGDVETGFLDDVKTRDRILGIGRSLAALNKNIIETFAKYGGRFFGTQQQNRSPDKEEGYVYIPENLSQEELKQMLDSIRKDYAGSIAKTVTFAVMNAADIARPPEGDLDPARFFLADVEVKLEMLLRKLKGPGFKDDPKPEGYGDKVGFYSSRGVSEAAHGVVPGGIDLKDDKFNLDIRQNGPAAEFKFDPAQWETLQIDGLTPNIITITPITDIPFFLSGDERRDNQLVLASG